jgi:hypothetical protein
MTASSNPVPARSKKRGLMLIALVLLALGVVLAAIFLYFSTPRLSGKEVKLATAAGAQVEQVLIDGWKFAHQDLDSPGLTDEQIRELVEPLDDSTSASGSAALERQLRIISEDAQLSGDDLVSVLVIGQEDPAVSPLPDDKARIALKLGVQQHRVDATVTESVPEYEVVWRDGLIINVQRVNSKEHENREYEFEKSASGSD